MEYQVKWQPQSTVELDGEHLDLAKQLIDVLYNLDDTQSVSHNLHAKE